MFVKVWIKEILNKRKFGLKKVWIKEQEEKKDARDCIYAPRHPFVYLSEFSFQTDFFCPDCRCSGCSAPAFSASFSFSEGLSAEFFQETPGEPPFFRRIS